MLSTDVVVEGAKCEELEKVIIGDDEEKFFLGRSSVASLGEGKADSVS